MKAWSIIESRAEYEEVIERIEELSKNPPDKKSDEGRELLLLGHLADRYEQEQFPIHFPDPVDAIKVRMEDLNLSVSDMLGIFGDRGTASKVLSRKRSLSLNMIRKLARRLSLPEALLVQPSRTVTRKKASGVLHEPSTRYQKRNSGKKKGNARG